MVTILAQANRPLVRAVGAGPARRSLVGISGRRRGCGGRGKDDRYTIRTLLKIETVYGRCYAGDLVFGLDQSRPYFIKYKLTCSGMNVVNLVPTCAECEKGRTSRCGSWRRNPECPFPIFQRSNAVVWALAALSQPSWLPA